MKKILTALALLCLFVSCRKSGTKIDDVPDNQPKIYFDGSPGFVMWSEIYSVNMDGTGQKQITDFSFNGLIPVFTGQPTLSADGKKIFFTSQKDMKGGELFSMNLDGTGLTKIISNTIAGNTFRDPIIYQNGQKVAYCMEVGSGANRHGEILTADINGANSISLINFPADGNCYHPTVNPANTTIVYSNLINGSVQLYAMDVNGANKRALTTGAPINKLHPQFSPDGTKIVFDADLGGRFEVFIMDANGSNMQQLTNYSNNGANFKSSWGPSFSKDGQTIYFSSTEFDGVISQLYKMNIDGTGKQKLTSSVIDKFNPCLK